MSKKPSVNWPSVLGETEWHKDVPKPGQRSPWQKYPSSNVHTMTAEVLTAKCHKSQDKNCHAPPFALRRFRVRIIAKVLRL